MENANMSELGRLLVVMGVITAVIGLLIMTGKRLPGDIFIQRENFTFFFPIVSSIVISVILTVLFNLFRR